MLNTQFDSHLAEDALESYLLNHCNEAEIARIETHYLACDECVTRLQALELTIATIKEASRDLHQEDTNKAYARHTADKKSWLSLPNLSVLGGVAAATVLTFSLVTPNHHPSPVVSANLTALRGMTQPLPKDQPLHLTLDASGLHANTATVILVDAHGSKLWEQTAPIQAGSVSLDAPAIHDEGMHYFRLLTSDQSPDRPREFAIDVH